MTLGVCNHGCKVCSIFCLVGMLPEEGLPDMSPVYYMCACDMRVYLPSAVMAVVIIIVAVVAKHLPPAIIKRTTLVTVRSRTYPIRAEAVSSPIPLVSMTTRRLLSLSDPSAAAPVQPQPASRSRRQGPTPKSQQDTKRHSCPTKDPASPIHSTQDICPTARPGNNNSAR